MDECAENSNEVHGCLETANRCIESEDGQHDECASRNQTLSSSLAVETSFKMKKKDSRNNTDNCSGVVFPEQPKSNWVCDSTAKQQ